MILSFKFEELTEEHLPSVVSELEELRRDSLGYHTHVLLTELIDVLRLKMVENDKG